MINYRAQLKQALKTEGLKKKFIQESNRDSIQVYYTTLLKGDMP